MANIYSGKVGSGLEVTEVDGTPDVTDVSKIVVSNGTLTDDGSGQVTITTGGGGGGVTLYLEAQPRLLLQLLVLTPYKEKPT